MDLSLDRHYLQFLFGCYSVNSLSLDTWVTHRSEIDIAVLKYLDEGLTVVLNSIVLSQIKQSVNRSS